MENAIAVNNNSRLNKIEGFQRVYYGNEFCQRLIPSLNALKAAYASIKKQKKNFTLLTPYVTNSGMEKIACLLDFLGRQDEHNEVVFNDWGVFSLLKKRYKKLEPVLGRLLTKQRRDPRAHDILLNCQEARRVFDKQNKRTYIMIPKEAPPSLYEHFKASVINAPVFQDFLITNGIRRVEIDSLAWKMKIKVNPEIGISVYLPYAYVSTTRLCGLVNLTYRECKKRCKDFYFSFKSPSSPADFYIKGNAVFYKTMPRNKDVSAASYPRLRYSLPKGINRIIWGHELID